MSSPRHLQESKEDDSPVTFRRQSAIAAEQRSLGLRKGGDSASQSHAREPSSLRRSSRDTTTTGEGERSMASISLPEGSTLVNVEDSNAHPPLRRSPSSRLPSPLTSGDLASPSDSAQERRNDGTTGGGANGQPLYRPEARSVGHPHPLYLRVPVKASPEQSPAARSSNANSGSSSSSPGAGRGGTLAQEALALTVAAAGAGGAKEAAEDSPGGPPRHDGEVGEPMPPSQPPLATSPDNKDESATPIPASRRLDGSPSVGGAESERASYVSDNLEERSDAALPTTTPTAAAALVEHHSTSSREEEKKRGGSSDSDTRDEGRRILSSHVEEDEDEEGGTWHAISPETLPPPASDSDDHTRVGVSTISPNGTNASNSVPLRANDRGNESERQELPLEDAEEKDEMESGPTEGHHGPSEEAPVHRPRSTNKQRRSGPPSETDAEAPNEEGVRRPPPVSSPSASSSSSSVVESASHNNRQGGLPRGLSISSGTSRHSSSSTTSSTRARRLQRLTAAPCDAHLAASGKGEAEGGKPSVEPAREAEEQRNSREPVGNAEHLILDSDDVSTIDDFDVMEDGVVDPMEMGGDGDSGDRPRPPTPSPSPHPATHASSNNSDIIMFAVEEEEGAPPPAAEAAPPQQPQPQPPGAEKNRQEPLNNNNTSSDSEPVLIASSAPPPPPPPQQWRHHPLSSTDETPSTIPSVNEATPARGEQEGNDISAMGVSAISPDGYGDSGGDGVVDEVEVSKLTRSTILDALQADPSRPHGTASAAAAPPAPAEPPAAPAPASAAAVAEEEPATPISEAHRENIPASVDQLASFFSAPSLTHPVVAPPSSSVASSELSSVMMQRMPSTADAGVAPEARAIVTETASEASSPDNRSRPGTSVPTDALRDAVSAADTSRLDVPGRSLMDEEEATAAQSRTEGGGRRFFSFNGDTDEEEADIRATSQRPSPPQQARDQQQHQQQPKLPVQRPLWGEGGASRDSDPDHPSHLLPTSPRTPPSLLLSDRVGHGPRGRDPLAPGRPSVSPTRGAQALPADASLFVTPYSDGVGAALSAPETSRQDDDRDLSLSTPSGGRQPSGNTGANSNSAAMVAQPTDVSAIIGGLYRAEAQKHMRTIVEVERESRIAMEDAFMRRWWEIVVEEAAAFGALPQALPLIRQRGRRRRADGADAWPPSPEAKEEMTMPAERSPLRLALPSTTHAYNFNLPKQWGGGVGTSHADSRHAPRRLVSPHAGIPQQHRGRRHGSGESAEDDDDDDDLPCGGLLDRSRTLSPKNSEAPAKWRRETEEEAEQGEGRADPDSSRVSGHAWAAMRLHAAESISANVYALSADEILYRSYLEDKERESFYLLVRVHQCVVDALQPAHLHLMQESARRAIEAECRRDERRIREYYGYATVEQELNHFRDAVRQRAVLVELEGKIRCDVIPVDEARERGQLAELFHLGLAGLVQQQEAVRAALDVRTREALEELVYSENRVREGVRVAEVRGRALLYQAAAHNARRRDGSPSLREEGKNVERQIDFAAAAAQTEEERRREEGDSSSSSSTPPRGADALPDVEYYVDDSGNLRTRLSLTQTEEEGRSDGQAERQFFEWNPTSNTNTSHSAIHTGDEANQDQRAGGGSPSGADNSGVERAQRSPSPRARSVRSDKDAAASPEERPRSQTVVVADAREAEASALMHALQRTTAANHQQQRRTHHHRKSSSSGSSNSRGEDASSCGSDTADFGGLLSDQTATAVGRDEAKPVAVKALPPEQHQSRNGRGKKPGRGLSGSPPANRHVVPCSLRPFPHRSYQSLLANGVGAVVAPSSPSISPQRRRQASGSPRRPYDESTLYACSPAQLRLLDSQRRRHHGGDPANWSTEEVVGDSPLDSTSLDSSPVSRVPLPPRPDPDADCAEVYVISPRRSARAVSSPLKRADSDEPLCNEVELSPPSPEASPARGHVSPRRRSPGYLAPTAASLRQRQSTALMRVLQQEEAVGERTGQRHGAAARTPLRKAAQCSQSRRVRFHADATAAAVGLGGAAVAVADSLRAASPLLVTRVPTERGAGAWPVTESPRNPYGLGGQAARVLAASHDRTHSAVVLPTPRPTRRQGSRDRRRRSPSVGGEVTTQVVACATLTDRDEDGDNELADHFEGCPPRVVRGPTSLGQRRKAQREVSSQGGGGGGGGGTPLPRQRAERVGRSPQPRRTPRPSPLPPSSYAHALREQSREAVNRRLGRLADACVAASGPPLRELAPPSPNLTRHSDTPSQNSYVGLHSGGAYWPGVVPHERSSKSFPQVPQKPTDARALRNGPSAGRQLRQPSPPSSNLSGSGFVTQPNGERTWMYGSPFFAAAIPQRRQA